MGSSFNQIRERDCRFDLPRCPHPAGPPEEATDACDPHSEEAWLQEMEAAEAAMGLGLGTPAPSSHPPPPPPRITPELRAEIEARRAAARFRRALRQAIPKGGLFSSYRE